VALAREWFLLTQIPSDSEEEEYQFGALRRVGLLLLSLVTQALPLLGTLRVMLSQLLRAAPGALRA